MSPDREPTLFEQGTDVHLNHPLTAQRSIHDSQPAHGQLGLHHPSSLRKGDEGRNVKTRVTTDRPYPGQGSGASRAMAIALPSEARRAIIRPMGSRAEPTPSNARVSSSGKWTGRPRRRHISVDRRCRLKQRRGRLKQTLGKHVTRMAEELARLKDLARVSSLLQGLGGYTRGCARAPPRKFSHTQNKQPCTELSGRRPEGTSLCRNKLHSYKASGATVGDKHKGSPNQGDNHPRLIRAVHHHDLHYPKKRIEHTRPTAHHGQYGPPWFFHREAS